MRSDSPLHLQLEDVRGKCLLIALSGGADSVALTLLLHEQKDALALELHAAHFHHGLRGADADADAAFCRELCARLGIAYHEARADVHALARANGVGLETAARDARYEFLRKLMKDVGASHIALAHHRDDQAETVLMHLLRGSGAEGACGMRRHAGTLFRPLLSYTKRELVSFLVQRGEAWREDATNALADNPRNSLRLKVMPEIERFYPAASAALARYASLMQMENDALESIAQRLYSERVQYLPCGERMRICGDEDETILRRSLRMLVRGMDWEQTGEVVALCKKQRGRLQLGKAILLEKTRDYLYLLKKLEVPEPTKLLVPGLSELKGICKLRAEIGVFAINAHDANEELVNPDALRGAVLRTRQEGDRIHPLGAPGTKLLSDYLIDRGVDRPMRDVLPLVAVGKRVLWACGLGLSEDAKCIEPSGRNLRLKIEYLMDE